MKNDLPLLQSTTLFSGLSAEELQALLTRLGAVERSFGRGEVLVLAGAPSRRVGVVLSGELEAYRPGPEGARVPITRVEPGGVFGDVLGGSSSCCSQTAAPPISGCCRIWCAPSATNTSCSPAGWTCWC